MHCCLEIAGRRLLAAMCLLVVTSVRAEESPVERTLLVDLIEAARWQQAAERLASGADVQASQPDGMTALHWAAFHGSASMVGQLIAAGGDVNASTEYGVTPLTIACTAPRAAAVVQPLLESGADPNHKLAGDTRPLMLAARHGDADAVSALIARGAQVDAVEAAGQTALMWAAAAGHVAAVEVLMNAGADPLATLRSSGFSPLMFAAREGHQDVVRSLIEAGVPVDTVMKPESRDPRSPRRGTSALMLAVESGHFELALSLVAAGADPNDQRSGYAPLHALTWVRKTNRGDGVDGDPPPRGSGSVHSLQFVRELVAAGADVNLALQRGSGGRAKLNHQGATPFLLAAKNADIALMKLLVQLGANPHLANADGCQPLAAAAGIGVIAVGEEAGTEAEVIAAIDWLVSLGADPNAVDDNGETAMHGAAYRNYPLVVTRLAQLGADPDVWDRPNKYGWTPEDIAAGQRPGSFKPSPETIAALRRAK